jgi:hypothetical protein
VLFEAITNAIHANATNIICSLNSSDNPLKENEVDIVNKKVDTISVIDNGDGLNKDNYNSFCKYRTEFKKALGCKGVGRFVFLKVYKNVRYKSQLTKEQEERTFKFNLDFDTENINIVPAKIVSNSTEISLSGLTSLYLDFDRHLDRRIDLDLGAIREKVLLNLIPTLFFYKKKDISIKIQFIDSTTSNTTTIESSDVPDFAEKPFKIKDKESKLHDFILNYRIEKEDGKLNAFYCANNRTVLNYHCPMDIPVTCFWSLSI